MKNVKGFDININHHNVKLLQPADLPEDYLPAADFFYMQGQPQKGR